MLKDHFPYAVTAIFFALMASGKVALAVLVIAFSLAMLPVVYAQDAAEIAKRLRDDD